MDNLKQALALTANARQPAKLKSAWFYWYRLLGSNQGPLDPQSSAIDRHAPTFTRNVLISLDSVPSPTASDRHEPPLALALRWHWRMECVLFVRPGSLPDWSSVCCRAKPWPTPCCPATACGDRRKPALISCSRFIPASIAGEFEMCAWPPAARVTPSAPVRRTVSIDLAARMRGRWRTGT